MPYGEKDGFKLRTMGGGMRQTTSIAYLIFQIRPSLVSINKLKDEFEITFVK